MTPSGSTWEALCARARDEPPSLSPWSVGQIAALATLDVVTERGWTRVDGAGLDTPVDVPSAGAACAAAQADPLAPVHGTVDERPRRFLAARRHELAAVDPALAPSAAEIAGLIAAGGKRLRPAFVYWGHRAAGGAATTRRAPASAAAVEMLHTFALLHDDVMDRAATRRGRPTAQHASPAHHRRAARRRRRLVRHQRGDPRR